MRIGYIMNVLFVMLLGLQNVLCELFNIKPWPTYSLQNMPRTSFTCHNKIIGGYYADAETECQMFHVCVKVVGVGIQDFRFLCPNGTTFDQESRICADWGDVDCDQVSLYYSSNNFDLYRLESSQAINGPIFKIDTQPIQRIKEVRTNLNHIEPINTIQKSDKLANKNFGKLLDKQNTFDDYNHKKTHLTSTVKPNKQTSHNDVALPSELSDDQDDLLKGSYSSNFFSNRNGGKEDDHPETYSAPKVLRIRTQSNPQRARDRKIDQNKVKSLEKSVTTLVTTVNTSATVSNKPAERKSFVLKTSFVTDNQLQNDEKNVSRSNVFDVSRTKSYYKPTTYNPYYTKFELQTTTSSYPKLFPQIKPDTETVTRGSQRKQPSIKPTVLETTTNSKSNFLEVTGKIRSNIDGKQYLITTENTNNARRVGTTTHINNPSRNIRLDHNNRKNKTESSSLYSNAGSLIFANTRNDVTSRKDILQTGSNINQKTNSKKFSTLVPRFQYNPTTFKPIINTELKRNPQVVSRSQLKNTASTPISVALEINNKLPLQSNHENFRKKIETVISPISQSKDKPITKQSDSDLFEGNNEKTKSVETSYDDEFLKTSDSYNIAVSKLNSYIQQAAIKLDSSIKKDDVFRNGESFRVGNKNLQNLQQPEKTKVDSVPKHGDFFRTAEVYNKKNSSVQNLNQQTGIKLNLNAKQEDFFKTMDSYNKVNQTSLIFKVETTTKNNFFTANEFSHNANFNQQRSQQRTIKNLTTKQDELFRTTNGYKNDNINPETFRIPTSKNIDLNPQRGEPFKISAYFQEEPINNLGSRIATEKKIDTTSEKTNSPKTSKNYHNVNENLHTLKHSAITKIDMKSKGDNIPKTTESYHKVNPNFYSSRQQTTKSSNYLNRKDIYSDYNDGALTETSSLKTVNNNQKENFSPTEHDLFETSDSYNLGVANINNLRKKNTKTVKTTLNPNTSSHPSFSLYDGTSSLKNLEIQSTKSIDLEPKLQYTKTPFHISSMSSLSSSQKPATKKHINILENKPDGDYDYAYYDSIAGKDYDYAELGFTSDFEKTEKNKNKF